MWEPGGMQKAGQMPVDAGGPRMQEAGLPPADEGGPYFTSREVR
jgi:hypothetical protein